VADEALLKELASGERRPLAQELGIGMAEAGEHPLRQLAEMLVETIHRASKEGWLCRPLIIRRQAVRG